MLNRLEAFLPEMRASNEQLSAAIQSAPDPSVFHVDHVSDEEEPHIAMVSTRQNDRGMGVWGAVHEATGVTLCCPTMQNVDMCELTPEMEAVFGEGSGPSDSEGGDDDDEDDASDGVDVDVDTSAHGGSGVPLSNSDRARARAAASKAKVKAGSKAPKKALVEEL